MPNPTTGLARAAWALLLIGAAAGCGDDDTTTRYDAPPTTTVDARTPDGPVTPTFTVHYHRADGVYTGWNVVPTAGATEAMGTPGTADGFGAVYTLTVTSGAPTLAFSLKNGGNTDDAGALSVDVSGGVREAWVISGWPQAIPRRLPALPGANQIAVYYLRADNVYDGWGLHLWGEKAVNTVWTDPVQSVGVDPDFGAGFVINVPGGQPLSNCSPGKVCIIVHKGDMKDPGPDMSFDPAVLGNVVFILTGSTDVTSLPRRIGDVGIAGIGAHLVAPDTLAWCLKRNASGTCEDDATLTQAELRYSATAEIAASGTEVTGGTVINLTRRTSGGLSAGQLAAAPYLRNMTVFDIAPADRAKLEDAVKGQLVAIARKADGKAGKATQVDNALYLDELYATSAPLGVTFAAGAPRFAVWAPTAQQVRLLVFDAAKAAVAGSPFTMTRSAQGVWEYTAAPTTWKGYHYRYEVKVYHPATGKVEDFVTTDPYAVNLSTNGAYTNIVDLDDPDTKPPGWAGLQKPPLAAFEDIVLYESHIRDFSISDPTTPADRRGKYLGFVTEQNATPSNGLKHLAALADAGLTHIHLLPAFDIATVDEDAANRVDLDDTFARLCQKNSSVPAPLCTMFPTQTIREAMASFPGDSEQQQAIAGYMRNLDAFNWGYDPYHFGAPEGSFASTAEGTAKILEFRRMVMGLAAVHLRVIMDVVYNHTNAAGTSDKSVLDKVVPNYYHRLDPDSGFIATSSCCQNTASEHKMMERLIVDMSVRFARDYKVDGFRFDLMGLHMKSNIVAVQQALAALTVGQDGVDGSKIYVYGEGWEVGELANGARGENASQRNMAGTGVGTFNDRLRDGARGGGPFDNGDALRTNQGFINGLYYDPNELSAANATTLAKQSQNTDLIKIGLAGGLKFFKMVNAFGTVVAAGAIGYSGQGAGYTEDPQENIVYTSAHDNQTLWDIVAYKLPTGTPIADRVRAHDLGMDVVLLAQGVPFLHMADDLLRSKSMDKNSYDSGDWFNVIDWSMQKNGWKTGLPPQGDNNASWNTIKKIFMDATATPRPEDIAAASTHVVELLKIRTSSPLFRLRTGADVMKRVDFLNGGPDQIPGLIVMTITDNACAGDDLDPARDGIVVVFNADKLPKNVPVPGSAGAVLHPIQAASADAVVKTASVAGTDLSVPARTTAVFQIPQSGDRGGGPPCNNR